MELDDLSAAVCTARDGRIAVICLHGVPDDHPFCSTTPALFERFVDHLADNEYTVIALRDLARYVDPWQRPADPYAPIEARLCVRPGELTCGYNDTPGVEDARPRFHWVLASDQRAQRQSAYRVLVASRREFLYPGRADRWDSGTVETGAEDTPGVTYEGRPGHRPHARTAGVPDRRARRAGLAPRIDAVAPPVGGGGRRRGDPGGRRRHLRAGLGRLLLPGDRPGSRLTPAGAGSTEVSRAPLPAARRAAGRR